MKIMMSLIYSVSMMNLLISPVIGLLVLGRLCYDDKDDTLKANDAWGEVVSFLSPYSQSRARG